MLLLMSKPRQKWIGTRHIVDAFLDGTALSKITCNSPSRVIYNKIRTKQLQTKVTIVAI